MSRGGLPYAKGRLTRAQFEALVEAWIGRTARGKSRSHLVGWALDRAGLIERQYPAVVTKQGLAKLASQPARLEMEVLHALNYRCAEPTSPVGRAILKMACELGLVRPSDDGLAHVLTPLGRDRAYHRSTLETRAAASRAFAIFADASIAAAPEGRDWEATNEANEGAA